MSKSYRSKVFLVRAAGAGEFTAADAIYVSNVELTPLAGDTVTRDLERLYYATDRSEPTNIHQTVQFSVEFAAQSTAGKPPPWARILRACGFAETLTAATSSRGARFGYNPVSRHTQSIKIGINIGGILHVLDRCCGTATLEFTANQIPRFQFTMTGTYAAPVDATAIEGTYSGGGVAIAPSHPATYVSMFGSTNVSLHSLSVDVGNEVVVRSPMNARQEIAITNRTITGSITIDAARASLFNPVSRAARDTPPANGEIQIVHGPVSGDQMIISIPNAAIGIGVSYQDDSGILQQQIPLEILTSSEGGNDEIFFNVLQSPNS